jgi:hypothetical protein
MLVSPPSAQCFTWWASQKREPHPGNRHPRSLASSARRSAGGIVLVLRPTSSTEPSGAWVIRTRPASQEILRDASAAMPSSGLW